MKFYSGFSLTKEELFFKSIIKRSEYSVCGFSYGAIKAIDDVISRLENFKRVDRLVLLSPAFFQTKPFKFKKLQLMAYKKSKDKYLRAFIDSCFLPYEKKIVQHKENTIEELEELLNYKYNIDDLKMLESRGVKIEVYLGADDCIIDANGAREFFLEVSTVTYIKNANHFLQTS